jgi:CheY-like chemotaxis protein
MRGLPAVNGWAAATNSLSIFRFCSDHLLRSRWRHYPTVETAMLPGAFSSWMTTRRPPTEWPSSETRRGHVTRTAFNESDALAAAAEFLPEVVLLDVGRPGMDGYEVARRIRTMPALAAVLRMTATPAGKIAALRKRLRGTARKA